MTHQPYNIERMTNDEGQNRHRVVGPGVNMKPIFGGADVGEWMQAIADLMNAACAEWEKTRDISCEICSAT